jgi:hypothetical protein
LSSTPGNSDTSPTSSDVNSTATSRACRRQNPEMHFAPASSRADTVLLAIGLAIADPQMRRLRSPRLRGWSGVRYPKCRPTAVKERPGRTALGYPRFRCLDCTKQFNERNSGPAGPDAISQPRNRVNRRRLAVFISKTRVRQGHPNHPPRFRGCSSS